MSNKTYTLDPGEKATQVMAGTMDLLVWGDLLTREQVRVSMFLNTLAEDYVELRDVHVLFLTPAERVAPAAKSRIYVKQEEILIFYAMADTEPLPEETETRRLHPLELFVGPYQIQGSIMKAPVAEMLQMLLVAKEAYMPVWQATIRHTGKPWLGAFTSRLVQVRMDRMTVAV